MPEENTHNYVCVPWSVHPEKQKLHHHAGVSYIIALGDLLKRLSSNKIKQDEREIVRRDIARLEKVIQYRWSKGKDAKNKLLRASCVPPMGKRKAEKKLDLRRLRAISICASETARGNLRIPVPMLTMTCVMGKDRGPGFWRSYLEIRRLLAGMMLEGSLTLVEATLPEIDATVRCSMSAELQSSVFGGKYCLPFLEREILDGSKELKRSRGAMSAGRSPVKKAHPKSPEAEFLESLPDMTPADFSAELEQRGYVYQVGQNALCLAFYRHIERLRRIHIDGVPVSELPADRGHTLVIGQSGSGKSQLLAHLRDICGLPCVFLDSTIFSQKGYIGEDTATIFTRLLKETEGQNPLIAQMGIVILDEISKLALNAASSQVSKDGVQREILKMCDGCVIDAPRELGLNGYRSSFRIDSSTVMFVGCGHFEGISQQEEKSEKRSIGFNDTDAEHVDTTSIYDRLSSFGILRELACRFTSVIELPPPTASHISTILGRQIERQAVDLRRDGIALEVEPDVQELLTTQAMSQSSGVRGAYSAIAAVLNDALFHAYSARCGDEIEIRLFKDSDDIGWSVGKKEATPKGKPSADRASEVEDWPLALRKAME